MSDDEDLMAAIRTIAVTAEQKVDLAAARLLADVDVDLAAQISTMMNGRQNGTVSGTLIACLVMALFSNKSLLNETKVLAGLILVRAVQQAVEMSINSLPEPTAAESTTH